MAEHIDHVQMDAHLSVNMMASDYQHAGLVDQTIDTTVVAMRADEQQKQFQNQLNKVVDGPQQPLAGPNGQNNNTDQKKPEEKKEPEKSKFVSDKVIYDSIHRSPLYYATAWLWCGCFEPKYKVTAEYAIGEEWYCCTRVTDSMAFENVGDISRSQPCCYSMLSCCCPCVDDMGNITLLGGDDTHKHGWTLKRLHRSTKVYEVLVKTIQASNANFKKAQQKK